MLPKRTKITLGIAWILFWALMIATSVQEYLRDEHEMLWRPVLWEASSAFASTLLLLAQRHYTKKYDTLVATPSRWFARQLLWLPLYWTAFVPIAFGIRHAVYALAGMRYTHMPWPQTFLYEDVKMTIFFSLFTTILFGVLSYHAMLNEKLRVERVNSALRQAQLMQLTQQMQPHFLFNALNTISSLMHSDVERADALLIQLADLLRTTLDLGQRHQAPLETELRLLRGYAALMSERFADRVRIEWHIDDTLLACQVPVMSMQPLLENIFKHTVERRRQATGIVISASREAAPGGSAGDMLVLRLDDDGGALPPAPDAVADNGVSVGIGVRNLRQRLDALYGAAATFELIQLSPAGVRAQLRLPCGQPCVS
jgi:hypothetical protein